MKEKIVIFIVGLLLGATISTGSIYIYSLTNNTNNNNDLQMPGDNNQMGQRGSMPPEMQNNNVQS